MKENITKSERIDLYKDVLLDVLGQIEIRSDETDQVYLLISEYLAVGIVTSYMWAQQNGELNSVKNIMAELTREILNTCEDANTVEKEYESFAKDF